MMLLLNRGRIIDFDKYITFIDRTGVIPSIFRIIQDAKSKQDGKLRQTLTAKFAKIEQSSQRKFS
jgi:hypothetical protein